MGGHNKAKLDQKARCPFYSIDKTILAVYCHAIIVCNEDNTLITLILDGQFFEILVQLAFWSTLGI